MKQIQMPFIIRAFYILLWIITALFCFGKILEETIPQDSKLIYLTQSMGIYVLVEFAIYLYSNVINKEDKNETKD